MATVLQKRDSISEMIGWEYIDRHSHDTAYTNYGWWVKGTYSTDADPRGNLNFIGISSVNFDSDANWQFKVMEIMEKRGFQFFIGTYATAIVKPNDTEFSINVKAEKKAAIFEALYQLSEYLKVN